MERAAPRAQGTDTQAGRGGERRAENKRTISAHKLSPNVLVKRCRLLYYYVVNFHCVYYNTYNQICKVKILKPMKSDYINDTDLSHVLALLMPVNRAAVECSLRYGMRIGDVLNLSREQVQKRSFTYTESKTGKKRRVTMCKSFADYLLSLSSYQSSLVFPSRLDASKPRTRQAVYKDIRRAAVALRCKEHISPHTARKVYAVKAYHRYGDLHKVQQLLNHDNEAVTMIYALADELTKRRLNTKKRTR